MKKTGLAVFFVLVTLLGLLAGQLGIAHLPWSSEDTDTAPGQAVTEQAAEAPARDGEATAPATGTEDAGQEKAPAAPEAAATAAEAETDQDAQPAVPLPEGAEIINGEAVVQLIDMMKKTKCNEDLMARLKEWVALWEKSGYLKK